MSTKKITKVGVLLAIAVLLQLIEIPYPPVPFLKFDLSDFIVLVAAVMTGFFPALFIAVVKGLTFYLQGTISLIGPIAAILASCIMLTTFYLIWNKQDKKLLPALVVGILVTSASMTLMNYLFVLPAYFDAVFFTQVIDIVKFETFGLKDMTVFPFLSDYANVVIVVFFPFNVMKYTIVSIVFALVYKKMKPVLHIDQQKEA